MKKVFALFAILVVFTLGMTQAVVAQEDATEAPATSAVTQTAAPIVEIDTAVEETESFHKLLKQKVIEGDAAFMSIIILCLVIGLAVCIERIIYLALSDTNTDDLLKKIDAALAKGDIEEAKEICRNTRGPVASIFYQGLSRHDQGIEVVEKTVVSYGGVQSGLMERGLPWISLFIGITPMIGFMGTVYGMIIAFDKIQQVGDLSATVIAGGIKLALITTVAALTVAITLQIFYNYIITKIDNLVGDMEDSSISLLDILIKYNLKSN